MDQYYLSDGQRKIGPFSIEQVREMVLSCRISLMDQVYNDTAKEWVPVITLQNQSVKEPSKPKKKEIHPAFVHFDPIDEGTRTSATGTHIPGLINSRKSSKVTEGTLPGLEHMKPKIMPQSIPQSSAKATIAETTAKRAELWQILRNGKAHGGFSYTIMLGMILEGVLQDHELIRKVGKHEWKPASAEFNAETLKGLRNEVADQISQKGRFRRAHARLDVGQQLHVSTGNESYLATLGDISEGGCSLIVNNPIFNVNDMLYLSIFPSENDGGLEFNAQGTVLSYVKNRKKEEYKFSVRFTAVTGELLAEIQKRMQAA